MQEDLLGIHNIDSGIGSAGVGFVVVPKDVNRVQYINDCYRTNTITMNGGRGYGYFSSVNVDPNVMQEIKFPTDDENRGTPVIWVRDSISQLPVVVASLRKQNDYYYLEQNQYRLKRGSEDVRNVEIFLDGNKTSLDFNLVGDEEEPADLNIKLSSANSDSEMNVDCDNDINVNCKNSINITSNNKVMVSVKDKGVVKMKMEYSLNSGLEYVDEFGNKIVTKDGEVDIISDKINHNNGKEPMVLGDTLVNILNELIDAIKALSVNSPVGVTSTPINTPQFTIIQNKLENIKSKISNLD